MKVEKLLSHSGVDVPWLKGSEFRRKIWIESVHLGISRDKEVEAMYTIGITPLKRKMKIKKKRQP